jgi:hypothetical protein
MRSKKMVYTVALDAVDIRSIEEMAKERDLPARVFLRQLILKSLRREAEARNEGNRK